MTTTTFKKILADKLSDEGTEFKYNDISINKTKFFTTKWSDELDDFEPVEQDAYKVVIKDFEHIHFFLALDNDDYFGNEVWCYERFYCKQSDTYEGSEIILDSYSKTRDHDQLVAEVLVSLGYHIANTF